MFHFEFGASAGDSSTGISAGVLLEYYRKCVKMVMLIGNGMRLLTFALLFLVVKIKVGAMRSQCA